MGTFAAVGLGLMGVPYFYVVALIAAIGETIPIVGPVIGGVTAVAGRAHRVAEAGADGRHVFSRPPPARSEHPRAEDHGAARRRQPGHGDGRAADRRIAVGLVGAILAIPTAAILSVIVDEVAADGARAERTRAYGARRRNSGSCWISAASGTAANATTGIRKRLP